MKNSTIVCAFVTGLLAALFASTPRAAETSEEMSEAELIRKVDARLRYQHGVVTLSGGIAKLNIPDGFRYIDAQGAEFVLVELWGNPPDTDTLGMIFPSDLSPASKDSWGVVITYSDDGYVSDADADKVDYDKLLRQMQSETRKANKERRKEGYTPMVLVGWAAPPHYDRENHKIYWAKELKFEGSEENTLNYNIRALGRRGVMNLNAVATMGQLPMIEKQMPDVVRMVEFTEGNRYADYRKGDQVAKYGIAALVAGGIAAKAGLFKTLIAMAIAGKKFLILFVIGLFAVAKKFFPKKRQQS